MRDYQAEFEKRVMFIKSVLNQSEAKGIVYGNSGGKDSALVGILCKAACDNTVGIILPCTSKRNYEEDTADAKTVAEKYCIETRVVDLTPVKNAELNALEGVTSLNASALANIAPRLRMLTLYAVAAAENRLVAGTGNRSEAYTGYFTKWGDGACDFNPVADLTVTEIYEFLRFLDAPECILTKKPGRQAVPVGLLDLGLLPAERLIARGIGALHPVPGPEIQAKLCSQIQHIEQEIGNVGGNGQLDVQ